MYADYGAHYLKHVLGAAAAQCGDAVSGAVGFSLVETGPGALATCLGAYGPISSMKYTTVTFFRGFRERRHPSLYLNRYLRNARTNCSVVTTLHCSPIANSKT